MAEYSNDTQFINLSGQPIPSPGTDLNAAEVIKRVYEALGEKGYNPVTQLVGYLLSGDPTYITNHKNARALIMKVERDDIISELMENYIATRL
ncbi:MAG: IreB family regulatory phosphoprotein [Lachnospiraceae bacterium]|nr:IreB family regulatory phosphoprotein [Lachnospiraceae bacterium]MBR0087871.1 IreB family regulatory phosphoprotein [Lachnospiraceae bacterium]